MAAPSFSIELTGLEPLEALFLRLSDFQKLARIPLTAGLGQAKNVMVDEVGSRKAAKSIKVRVRRDATGLTGKVGPTGGDGRPGFLAALFLESGTGLEGPRHQLIEPSRGRAMAFFSQEVVTARFGDRAQLFTQSGRLRKAAFNRYGNAGQAVIRSDRGAPAKPWFARAISRAKPLVSQKFADKLHEELASRG